MNKAQEIAILENTLKLLRKGKYELTGEEALVFYTSFDYLIKKINQLKQPEIVPSATPVNKIEEPVKSAPKKKAKE